MNLKRPVSLFQIRWWIHNKQFTALFIDYFQTPGIDFKINSLGDSGVHRRHPLPSAFSFSCNQIYFLQSVGQRANALRGWCLSISIYNVYVGYLYDIADVKMLSRTPHPTPNGSNMLKHLQMFSDYIILTGNIYLTKTGLSCVFLLTLKQVQKSIGAPTQVKLNINTCLQIQLAQ